MRALIKNNDRSTDNATPCRGTENILLVEDDAPVRELTAALLERSGYRVISAETSDQAIFRAAATRGPIHLVITDVIMPRGNGAQLAMKLAAGGLRAPTLFMSGYEPSLLSRQGNLAKGSHFLQKPFTGSTLLTRVRQLLEPGSPPAHRAAPRRHVKVTCAS